MARSVTDEIRKSASSFRGLETGPLTGFAIRMYSEYGKASVLAALRDSNGLSRLQALWCEHVLEGNVDLTVYYNWNTLRGIGGDDE